VVKGIWFYEVPEEKQAEYLRKTAEIIRPFWESRECISYEVYQDYTHPRRFVKIQSYATVEAMERDGALFFQARDPSAVEAVETCRSYAQNVDHRLCVLREGPQV